MPIKRLSIVFLSCLALSAPSRAGEPAFAGKSDCRIAPVEPAPTRVGVSWNGACKDGYAEGQGVLEWYGAGDRGKRRLEANLVRGEVSGAGKLAYPGGSYLGSFRRGVPHGAGYFEYRDGAQYEGGVTDGQPDGSGTRISADGSLYEGEWKAGKRHGRGKETFTLGGRYEGEWRDDEFNGQGSIVYGGSGRRWSGEFRDGFASDLNPRPRRDSRRDDVRNTGDLAWEALPAAQQNALRNSYPALDDRDEPPYPLPGQQGKLKDALSEFYSRYARLELEGQTLVYVTVGPDGIPASAKAYSAPHPEFGRAAAMAMMMQRYKPGLCAGKPCEMIYPVKFLFTLE
ncbi:energy transducer TonB [Massilia oculi]|uniref:Energy transducer TonB n=1 Tax=Massilia hydrophila TaxID=3044279 RepID=A0ABS7YE39_9BURK|nr:energy transducer TonB [Massilia oculi]MCA1857322.1 energy transducer TonB [Massilia oculi]